MAINKTTNYNLNKPTGDEFFNVSHQNDNMDLIDSALNTKLDKTVYTASDVLTKIKTVDGTGSGLDADKLDGLEATEFATAAQGTKADNALPASSYTASDVLTKIKTVDGAGSGLDADTVDGIHANDFIQKTDKITLPANTTVRAYFNIPNSNVAPISPINGDIWQRDHDLFARLNDENIMLYHSGNAATANLTTVSQPIAESGTNTGVYAWTSKRVHQAINANLINSSKLFANASGIKGTGTGTANEAYFEFNENNGTTRQGYIGFGSANDNVLTIANTMSSGDVNISTTGKATVNGNEILRANTLSMIGDGSYVLGRTSDDRSIFAFLSKTDYTTKGYVGFNDNLHMAIQNYRANGDIRLITAGTGKAKVNGNEIWHEGNLKAKTDETLYNEILGTLAGTLITSGTHNQAIGHASLNKNVGGSGNTAIGSYALFNNTGHDNFAIGQKTLYENTTGTNNIGIGMSAVYANTTGSANIGIGTASLWALASGQNNIGIGHNAGRYRGSDSDTLTTANQCVYLGAVARASANNVTNEIVIGYNAIGKGSNTAIIGNTSVTDLYVGNRKVYHEGNLKAKTTYTNSFYGDNAGRLNVGSDNTGIGERALYSASLTGSGNTAVGKDALSSNSSANYNTGIGMRALDSTSSGSNNVAVGTWALQPNTSGTYNIGIGVGAGRFYGTSTNMNTNSNRCIYIGYNTRSNANNDTNEIVIGHEAKGYGSNTAHIGNSSVASISFGAGTGTAFTNRSDRRLKEEILDADTSICYNDIKNLPLHRFKYKDFVGNEGDIHLTGFIADEFEQVFPKAVFKNDFSFPLLDEFGQPVMKTITEIDENGNEVTREVEETFVIEQCASIDTSQIVPTLLGCTQKLIEKIEILEAEIATLKNK